MCRRFARKNLVVELQPREVEKDEQKRVAKWCQFGSALGSVGVRGGVRGEKSRKFSNFFGGREK